MNNGADLNRAVRAMHEADNIIIGGGAGLSDAAGLKYYGERFFKNFGAFIEKYDFSDMYSAGFYPFPTQEEKWAYWAKHISVNRHTQPVTELYQDLHKLVADKTHFIITTNVDAQFTKAGFDADKIFAVQGDYGYFQCARGCHQMLYFNERQVVEMVKLTKDCRIPSALIPKCPVCGGEMEVHIRKDGFFVQNDDWYAMHSRYTDFINNAKGKTVFLELGVGFNTPTIIRIPFEQMVYNNPKAILIRINKNHPGVPPENAAKTIAFTDNMEGLIKAFIIPQEIA